MAEFTTSLVAQLQRAVEAVKDEIAKEGLMALKKVLDPFFMKSPHLKDYDIYAHIAGHDIIFEILVKLEAVDIDPKLMEETAKSAIDAWEDAADRTYQVLSRGGFSRVARLRDARRPIPSALNRPKRTGSNLREWGRKTNPYGPKNALRGPQERIVNHKMAMSMPRDMNINREGRLQVSFKRQTRTTKSGEIHFPQGKFQGIVKKFLDELKPIIAKKFVPELEKILKNYVSE